MAASTSKHALIFFHRCADPDCQESGGCAPVDGGCAAENVLPTVEKECNNKESCLLVASNSLFKDPCPYIYKYLNVIYSCEYDSE